MHLKLKIVTAYLATLVAGIALSALLLLNGRSVLDSVAPLVGRDLPLLESVAALRAAATDLEPIVYQYYASTDRLEFMRRVARNEADRRRALSSVAALLPGEPRLGRIAGTVDALDASTEAIDEVLKVYSKQPVDWDQAREILHELSTRNKTLQADLDRLVRDAHANVRASGSVTEQKTRLTMMVVLGVSVAILVAAAFLGIGVHRFLLQTASQRRLALFVERNPNPVLRLNGSGDVESANPSAQRLAEALELGPPGPRALLPTDMASHLGAARTGEEATIRIEHRVGLMILEISIHHVAEFDIFHVYVSDITVQRLAQDRVEYLAYHDPLTGMPNRTRFEQDIAEAVKSPPGEGGLSLMLTNLDNLRSVTQSLGARAADQAMIEVARRIVCVVGQDDGIRGPYRLDGATFALIAVDRSAQRGLDDNLAREIARALDTPVNLDGHRIFLTMSSGLTCGEPGEGVTGLLRKASVALAEAKTAGHGMIRLYDSALDRAAAEKLALQTDLRDAETRGELFLLYQPQLDLATRKLVGAEALVRWRHPTRGPVSPGQFIPIAEQTALILPIGRWVMQEATNQLRRWQMEGLTGFRVAINVSARQFGHPEFLANVHALLAETGVPPECIDLEITESIAMQELDRTINLLSGLKDLGFVLSIDDFGTGFSSLSYLNRLPIDKLKLDQSFVRGLPGNPNDRAIAQAVLDMGHRLGLQVVAEGVETRAQFDWLRDRGCTSVQGYLISRPVAPDLILDMAADSGPGDTAQLLFGT